MGRLSRDEIEYLKDHINISKFYESELGGITSANGTGWAKAGLCPFHDDQKAGNFYIKVDKGCYKCFACGAKGGDVIKFLMMRYSLTFGKAVAKLESFI